MATEHAVIEIDAVTGFFRPRQQQAKTVYGRPLHTIHISPKRLCLVPAKLTGGIGPCNPARRYQSYVHFQVRSTAARLRRRGLESLQLHLPVSRLPRIAIR
jgi:hypothetical protein